MNRLDIIRMAKEAACGWAMNGTEPLLVGAEHLERFAELVAAAEREKHKYWQGLTDEQVDELARTMVKGDRSVNWLARAIEAALKEKNT